MHGGTAPIDMMLNLVGLRFRQRMVARVAEQFILERIRGTTDVHSRYRLTCGWVSCEPN